LKYKINDYFVKAGLIWFILMFFIFEAWSQPKDLVLLNQSKSIIYQIKYATKDNFTGKQIYDCPQCWVHRDVKTALDKVIKLADAKGYKVVLYDCYRPSPYQWKLWETKPDSRYVMHPKKGSIHSRGGALDIGLADGKGNELDFGTPYDSFLKKSHRNAKGLTTAQIKNRKLLDSLLYRAGFVGIRTEWWHFDYKGSRAWPLRSWKWSCESKPKQK
jgi:D-alanyl-D-alanine dipeptidase